MARSFNGATDRLDYPLAFDTTSQPLTVSAWFTTKSLALSTSEYIWSSRDVIGTEGIIVYQSSTGAGRFGINKRGATNFTRLGTSASLFVNTWAHIAVTCDGSVTAANSFVYINGVEVSYTTTTNGNGEYATNLDFAIGGNNFGDTRNWEGNLAEIGIWNRELKMGEILALANGRSPSEFPALLKFYVPLDADLRDRQSGYVGTPDGTYPIAHPYSLQQKLRPLQRIYSVVSVPSLHVATTGMRW